MEVDDNNQQADSKTVNQTIVNVNQMVIYALQIQSNSLVESSNGKFYKISTVFETLTAFLLPNLVYKQR